MSKMFNCQVSSLLELTHDEVWYGMLKDRNHVRIPGTNPIKSPDYKYIKDQPDNEWEILDRDGVNIHENEAYVNNALSSPQIQLSHPRDVFFYDNAGPSNGTQDYGVLVLTEAKKNPKYLTRQWQSRITAGQPCSWKKVLEKFHKGKTPPSNALVIIDRYLFASDYSNGIRNVIAILDELLPDSILCEYHVLLVFDGSAISQGASIDLISNGFQQFVVNFSRNYNLTIELLTVSWSVDKKAFSETHDRRIVSNYYMISCDHGFSAIRIPNGQNNNIGTGVWSQTIRFEGIYAGIDADAEDLDLRSLPIRTCDYAITFLREYLLKLQNGITGYTYKCVGNPNATIVNFRNRLIK